MAFSKHTKSSGRKEHVHQTVEGAPKEEVSEENPTNAPVQAGVTEALVTGAPVEAAAVTAAPASEATSVPAATGAPLATEAPIEENVEIEQSLEETTMAPGEVDAQFTTTSLVSSTVTAGSQMTTIGTDASSKKRRVITKMEAANEFVYGRTEEPWSRPDRVANIETSVSFRPNRTHEMRQSCVMKRAVNEEREKPHRTDDDDSGSSSPSQSDSDDESKSPIVARHVPKAIYGEPKIRVKDTKSSKFRYLLNRKPPGVNVYFKPNNADPKKKPPFVVSAVKYSA